ncbi:MAG: prolyl oligopeptidase family serine peptidase [Breznakibacter sp.]
MKKTNLFIALLLTAGNSMAYSQTEFKLPPIEILEIADVKAAPLTSISPKNQYMALLERSLYKSLEELAEDELKLAGLRINPQNFNESRARYYTGLQLQHIVTGQSVEIKGLPEPLKIQSFSFSPDEKMCAFVNQEPDKLSLWAIDLSNGQAKQLLGQGVNATMGNAYEWGNDSGTIFCRYIGNRQRAEATKELAKGPSTQDATGDVAPARTYQDLLKNQRDEQLFDHYAQCAYWKISTKGDAPVELLPNALYKKFSVSPNGQYLLVETIERPYSYTLTLRSFPSQTTIYTLDGRLVKHFYNRPLQDKIPIGFDATENGKRYIFWRADVPHTLMWCEAPDGGDPKIESEFRDELFQSAYPFDQAEPICKIKNRLNGIYFGQNGSLILTDYWRKNRNTRTYYYEPSMDKGLPRVLFDRSDEDAYSDPGSFITEPNQFNRQVLKYSKDGKKLYLQGEGYSAQGNRPFVDEFELAGAKSKRLWQADGKSTYERIVRVVDTDKRVLITSIESANVFPNFYLRNYGAKSMPRQLTFRENPYKVLENVSKQKIHYKRADGVNLSANLYLPAGYDKMHDGRLPLLMEAYPTEYKDDKAAGQLTESPHAFMSINWASPVFWVTRGFAVLEGAQFPIIGKGDEEPNDTYIEQLVADAAAAIHVVDSMGIVDPQRCAVMGHSYGAFMTANLLAHSDLFVAGLARSGAYNRTLTPFGFQAEERTYWQAKNVYDRMSPFTYADKLKTPILFIHGDADNNPGTFTLQSERLFQAVKGNGGVARLVLLPYESHSYAARENILHMLWEMDSWLTKYVKDKK